MTQHCARYIYEQMDEVGQPCFAGIRYPSRHNLDWTCWAVFEDRMVFDPSFNEFHDTRIDPKDPDLLQVLQLFGLSLEAIRGHNEFIRGS